MMELEDKSYLEISETGHIVALELEHIRPVYDKGTIAELEPVLRERGLCPAE